MKKQVMVAMASAMAITPIATSITQVSALSQTTSQVAATITKALNEKYSSPNQNGINITPNGSVKPYENSRYAVILETTSELKINGLEEIANTKYNHLLLDRVEDTYAQEAKLAKDAKDALVTASANANKIKLADEKATRTANLLQAYKDAKLKQYVFTDVSYVGAIIEKISSDKNAQILIVDKGIKDGSSTITSKTNMLTNFGDDAPEQYSMTIGAFRKECEALTKYVVSVSDLENNTFKATLKSGAVLTFKSGDAVKDLTKPLLKDGSVLKDSAVNDESVIKNVVNFQDKANADDSTITFDVPRGDIAILTLDNAQPIEMKLSDIATKENGYTIPGASFVNMLVNAKKNNYTFNYNGKNYALATPAKAKVSTAQEAEAAIHTETASITARGNLYQLTLDVDVVDNNDKSQFDTLRFIIEGENQPQLAKLLKDITADKEVFIGRFEQLAGRNRIETAIEISKNNFKENKADTVVITGAYALMDGLSAAPLASIKNAPVLLSTEDGLTDNTINEIKRATDNKLKTKTVYIVGGEKSVPLKVEKQLEELGAVVIRLQGPTRYDTSFEVTKRLVRDQQVNNTIYVTGGEGEADAMSIAPIASKVSNKQVSPILVVRKDALGRETRDYVKEAGFTSAYLIGGSNTATTDVYKELSLVAPTERIAGINRYETNLDILAKFAPNPSKLAITSGKSNYLVDALSYGSAQVPMLLVDNALSVRQNAYLKGKNVSLLQVGGVVSADIMNSVLSIIGL